MNYFEDRMNRKEINPMKRITVCFGFIALLLAMTACTSVEDSLLQKGETRPLTSAAEPSKTIAFPRQKKTNGEWAAMDALANGTLVLEDNCLRFRVSESDTSYMLIWPPDFRLKEDDGKIIKLNENNKIVASIGDRVQMSGGEKKLLMLLDKSIQEQVPSQCTEPFWLIGYEFATIDSSK